jgi:hypothetical protein
MSAEDADLQKAIDVRPQTSTEVVPTWDTLGTSSLETSKRPAEEGAMPAPETARHRVRRRSQRHDADDAGLTAATLLADWSWQQGASETAIGALLEGLASILDDDDAFAGLAGCGGVGSAGRRR